MPRYENFPAITCHAFECCQVILNFSFHPLFIFPAPCFLFLLHKSFERRLYLPPSSFLPPSCTASFSLFLWLFDFASIDLALRVLWLMTLITKHRVSSSTTPPLRHLGPVSERVVWARKKKTQPWFSTDMGGKTEALPKLAPPCLSSSFPHFAFFFLTFSLSLFFCPTDPS